MGWITSMIRNVLPFGGIVNFVLIVLPITLALFYYFKRRHMVQLINRLPGPKCLPILGNTLDFNVKPSELFQRVISYCDPNVKAPAIRLWLGMKPHILIYKPTSAEVVLSSSKYIDKSDFYTILHPWLGLGLLTQTGQKWHQRRKMLTPSFHFSILDHFVDVFNQQGAIFLKNIESKADGRAFNIYPNITLCTLDIIMETAMGRTINAQDNSESDYVKAIYKLAEIMHQRIYQIWLKPDILFRLLGYAKQQDACLKILHGYSYATIQEKRKAYQQQKLVKKETTEAGEEEILGKKKRLAFLDMLLKYSDENEFLSDREIREEVDTFMFEGHDTTASSISFCIYLLGENPDIQEKVFKEIHDIFGDSDRDATAADLRELKFLECCMKEALRIFPSVPMFGRELFVDVDLDGYTIPAGTTAMFFPYCLHRDTSQFPEPEKFKPERFSPENVVKLHPYAYLPFSAGPRNCIGQKFALMEEKAILSAFLRKYRVESITKREDLQLSGEIILRPEVASIVKVFHRT